MTLLTERQKEVLDFIRERMAGGTIPTMREAGKHFEIAHGAAYEHIKVLEKKGYLKRGKTYQSRALKLTKKEVL